MTDEPLGVLRRSVSLSVARQAVFALEDMHPPHELQRMLPDLLALEGVAHHAVRASPVFKMLAKGPAQRYERTSIAPGVTMFRGGPSPAGRGLLVVLSGRHPRPMMAVSMFLQHVPAPLFDVLLLFDSANDHYVNGIAGYADGLFGLARRVVTDSAAESYRRLYFYGVSSGGMAAIQMAVLVGAFRGIALGGLFPWPINRLENGERFDAFDPICVCNRGPKRDLLFVHAPLETDEMHARRAIRVVGGRGVRLEAANEHNVLRHLEETGRLHRFHQQVLGFRPDPQGRPEFTQAP